VPAVHVTPALVSLLVLPPLLYSAATELVLTDLRAVLAPVTVLAVGLVVATAVAVGYVAHLVVPAITVQVGLVLGAVLASTDPVAVAALARRLQLPPRLLALVGGESLLNDATSLVLFRVVVGGVAAGQLPGAAGFTGRCLGLGLGGAAIGLVGAYLVRHLHQRTDDTVIEAVISLVTPYAVYVVAEVAHTSGVTAVVFAGLYLSRRRYQMSRGPARLQIANIYAVVVFLLESAVFAVIGLELPDLVRHLPANQRGFALDALALTGVLLVARVLAVSAASRLPGVPHRRPGVVAVTSWAGTRGVVPLAAALSMPLTVHGGAAFPQRDLLLVLATTCTAITLVVQGLTLRPLVQRAGITADPKATTREEALARHAAVAAAVARLEDLADVEGAPPAAVDWLRREFGDRLQRAESALRGLEAPDAGGRDGDATASEGELRSIRRELIGVESARLQELTRSGVISEAVRRRVQRMLDLEEARAADE
jgi:CPA1 family monovalent cation:H+ antiporter